MGSRSTHDSADGSGAQRPSAKTGVNHLMGGHTPFLTDHLRVRLTDLVTPLEPLLRFSEKLGGPNLFAKRDDMNGFAMGGNKVRQMEYYFGQVLAEGADTVLSTSAVQSNHLRVVAAACAKFNLRCILQREDRVKAMPDIYHRSGNTLLQELYGAEILNYPEGEDEEGADARLHEVARQISEDGGNPFIIHLGISTPSVGVLGYVAAATEILAQAYAQGLRIDAVVTPSGSAATHAGLLTGLRLHGHQAKVFGICVRRSADLQKKRVWQRVTETLSLLERPDTVTEDDVMVHDRSLGAGYGIPNADTMSAIKTLAQSEAMLLDPVYTGKTMAGLIQLVTNGTLRRNMNVVFLHTGGLPALYAYQDFLVSS